METRDPPVRLVQDIRRPRGRVSRKAMETFHTSSNRTSSAPMRPRGRVSRKAMETRDSCNLRFRDAAIVREDALAERQWRRRPVHVLLRIVSPGPRGRVSRKAMETHERIDRLCTGRNRGPRGRVSRKAMETPTLAIRLTVDHSQSERTR